MKTYGIYYSLLGGGYIKLEANSKAEAEEFAFNLTDEELIENTDFHKSLEIDSIEIIS
jgi:hypothetical protein